MTSGLAGDKETPHRHHRTLNTDLQLPMYPLTVHSAETSLYVAVAIGRQADTDETSLIAAIERPALTTPGRGEPCLLCEAPRWRSKFVRQLFDLLGFSGAMAARLGSSRAK